MRGQGDKGTRGQGDRGQGDKIINYPCPMPHARLPTTNNYQLSTNYYQLIYE